MTTYFRILPGGIDTTPLQDAIPPLDRYDEGYRNALESMIFALAAQGVPHDTIDAAITEAVDAFGNNAPDPGAKPR